MRRAAIIVPALVLMLAACSRTDDLVLAEVEGHEISWDRFRTSYVEYLASTGLPDEPRRRTGHLERLISMELVRLDAMDRGLAETDAWGHASERARRRLLVDAWLWHAGFDTITVDESELEDLFVRVNTQVTARHLFAPTREAADELAGRLADGSTFAELAAEVFADPVLAANGGSLGTFGFDEMDPAFEEAAFSLPVGGISGPVRTSQGWSIIRVDDRVVRPVMTESEFAARRPQLAAFVVEREKARVRRRIMQEAWDGAHPTLDPETVGRLIALTGPGASDPETGEPDPTAPLVTYMRDGESVTWTVADFLDAAEYTDDSQREAVRDPQSFEAFVTGLVIRDILMERALATGLQKDERYRRAFDAAMDEWVYERGYELIASSQPVPEDTLRAYFETQKEEFVTPERVTLREIIVESAATADSLRRALERTSFEELARLHSLSTGSAADGGTLGAMSREDLGPFADRVFDAPVGAVIGPVPMRGYYMLLEIGERQPPRQATFAEVRDDIETVLRRRHRARLVRERAASLRARFRVYYADVDLAALPLHTEPVVSS